MISTRPSDLDVLEDLDVRQISFGIALGTEFGRLHGMRGKVIESGQDLGLSLVYEQIMRFDHSPPWPPKRP